MAELCVKQGQVESQCRPRYSAPLYSTVRPDYPSELFQLLASLTKLHELAWDVGTGNGQAATAIAELYSRVIATDASESQLQHALKRNNISYKLTPVKLSDEDLYNVVGEEGSVDLVTLATALHWFDLPVFYAQVKRVLRKPGGIFAAWTYKRKPLVDDKVDAVFDNWCRSVLPYFAPEAKYVEEEYRTIPFPFDPVLDNNTGIGPVVFESVKQLSLSDYLQFFRSWSCVRKALEEGVDLLAKDVENTFQDAWGPPSLVLPVRFPIFMLVGTVPPPA